MRNHQNDDLKQRTKRFALRVLELIDEIPRGIKGDVLSKQLLRAATSVGANYRAACRAKSRPDFISKLGNAEEEVARGSILARAHFRFWHAQIGRGARIAQRS